MPPGVAVFGNEQTGTILSTPAPYEGLNIKAGVQEDYDPLRMLWAPASASSPAPAAKSAAEVLIFGVLGAPPLA